MSIFSLFYFCQICLLVSFYCFMVQFICDFVVLLQYLLLEFDLFFELSKLLFDFLEFGISESINCYNCWIFYLAQIFLSYLSCFYYSICLSFCYIFFLFSNFWNEVWSYCYFLCFSSSYSSILLFNCSIARFLYCNCYCT